MQHLEVCGLERDGSFACQDLNATGGLENAEEFVRQPFQENRRVDALLIHQWHNQLVVPSGLTFACRNSGHPPFLLPYALSCQESDALSEIPPLDWMLPVLGHVRCVIFCMLLSEQQVATSSEPLGMEGVPGRSSSTKIPLFACSMVRS